ncbi:craniofacial development protein 2-like [Cydia splendana]|uniref:craniofacial development protein 2-like n=1 Tax=Cydia splendana TaxID=1100963 RepID=UPI00300D363D
MRPRFNGGAQALQESYCLGVRRQPAVKPKAKTIFSSQKLKYNKWKWETKWKGSKSKDIGNDYQVIYHGVDNKRNGVVVVLDHNFKSRIVNITRKSDRLIAVKLALNHQQVTNIISAYAPQIGCTETEKLEFWEDFDELLQGIPSNEYKIFGGDLNGHVGATNETYINVHGGFGMGKLNKQGEAILDFAARHSLTLVNTNFKKRSEHLTTYKCAGKTSQIDYRLY